MCMINTLTQSWQSIKPFLPSWQTGLATACVVACAVLALQSTSQQQPPAPLTAERTELLSPLVSTILQVAGGWLGLSQLLPQGAPIVEEEVYLPEEAPAPSSLTVRILPDSRGSWRKFGMRQVRTCPDCPLELDLLPLIQPTHERVALCVEKGDRCNPIPLPASMQTRLASQVHANHRLDWVCFDLLIALYQQENPSIWGHSPLNSPPPAGTAVSMSQNLQRSILTIFNIDLPGFTTRSTYDVHFALSLGSGLYLSKIGMGPLTVMTLEELREVYEFDAAHILTPPTDRKTS